MEILFDRSVGLGFRMLVFVLLSVTVLTYYLHRLLLVVKCVPETAKCDNGRERAADERRLFWSRLEQTGESP
jgi:hypothetical protein